ncbi:MAG: hypothetical protein WAV15_00785, partial [Minisyncoccia bacterium]
ALKDKSFENKEGEEAEGGEKRREAAQAKVNGLFERAEQMKKKVNSKEELPDYTDSISTAYTHPDNKLENITFSLEEELQESIKLYKKTKLDLPPDFEDKIKEIWENNLDAIQKAIEENGFDEILVIPATPDIGDLSKKMKMNNAYYDYIKSSSNVQTLDGIPLVNQSVVDKPRIVLVHKTHNLKDRPELERTLNIKGQDVKMDQTLTLEDYLIFQRKYFEKNGKHLDEEGWTWLATKSGSRLVSSLWNPGTGKLGVRANDLGSQDTNLGARPSRSFF